MEFPTTMMTTMLGRTRKRQPGGTLLMGAALGAAGGALATLMTMRGRTMPTEVPAAFEDRGWHSASPLQELSGDIVARAESGALGGAMRGTAVAPMPGSPAGSPIRKRVAAPAEAAALEDSGDLEGSYPTGGGHAFGTAAAGQNAGGSFAPMVTGGGEALWNSSLGAQVAHGMAEASSRPDETPIPGHRFRDRENGLG